MPKSTAALYARRTVPTPAPSLLAGDEHGRLDFSEADRELKVGDRLEFVIPHCDPTVNPYDRLYAVRGDRIEKVWKIAARGMSQEGC